MHQAHDGPRWCYDLVPFRWNNQPAARHLRRHL